MWWRGQGWEPGCSACGGGRWGHGCRPPACLQTIAKRFPLGSQLGSERISAAAAHTALVACVYPSIKAGSFIRNRRRISYRPSQIPTGEAQPDTSPHIRRIQSPLASPCQTFSPSVAAFIPPGGNRHPPTRTHTDTHRVRANLPSPGQVVEIHRAGINAGAAKIFPEIPSSEEQPTRICKLLIPFPPGAANNQQQIPPSLGQPL